MPNTLMQSVVGQLQKERTRLADELRRVTAALTAFGKVYVNGLQWPARNEPCRLQDGRE